MGLLTKRIPMDELINRDFVPSVITPALINAAQVPNNNLMNLFELPVLFYVACILLHVLALVDAARQLWR